MKRRILCLLIAVCAALCVWQLPAASARAESFTSGEISGSNVALREHADDDADVITRLSRGTIVEILETNVNAEWHRVRVRGLTGYVNRMYVCLDGSLASYKTALVGTVVNCESDVNVRAEPKTSGKLIGKAKKGETYTVTAQNAADGWCAIEYDGKAAYISSRYLSLCAAAEDDQLSGLTVTGGQLSPRFAPGEYGYVLVADSDKLAITAEANDGVSVSVDSTGKKTLKFTMPSSGSRTIRIAVGGKIRYSVYVVRNALIVGSWNIKRGNGNLVQQGRLIEDQLPDIMGIQEAVQSNTPSAVVDNLLSLRTKTMKYPQFSATVKYGNGLQYGIGILSRYKILSSEVIPLTSLDKEPRVLQKVVFSVNGRKVSFYNTHFSYESSTIRLKQFSETLSVLEKDTNKYKILVGDFNAQAKEFAKIKGYQVINAADTKFYGYDGKEFKKTTVDNIVVSKSFIILNARMIDSTLSDHKPLFAYLRFD